jgi:hypothetical protein
MLLPLLRLFQVLPENRPVTGLLASCIIIGEHVVTARNFVALSCFVRLICGFWLFIELQSRETRVGTILSVPGDGSLSFPLSKEAMRREFHLLLTGHRGVPGLIAGIFVARGKKVEFNGVEAYLQTMHDSTLGVVRLRIVGWLLDEAKCQLRTPGTHKCIIGSPGTGKSTSFACVGAEYALGNLDADGVALICHGRGGSQQVTSGLLLVRSKNGKLLTIRSLLEGEIAVWRDAVSIPLYHGERVFYEVGADGGVVKRQAKFRSRRAIELSRILTLVDGEASARVYTTPVIVCHSLGNLADRVSEWPKYDGIDQGGDRASGDNHDLAAADDRRVERHREVAPGRRRGD